MQVEDGDVTANAFQQRSAIDDLSAVEEHAGTGTGLQESKTGQWSSTGRILLLVSLICGAVTHGYHLFQYPLYITDEGIYMERAWAILREGRLSPYTYNYDHAPAGWIAIATWTMILPHQLEAFGTAENTGRVLMLLAHLASVFLLFQVTRKLSGSLTAAFVATFFFNCSPLAIFYQREVVLDNLMVFWVLLSLYLVTRDDHRVLTPMLGGLAFGIGVLTKENAVFFLPALGYALYGNARQQFNHRFALSLSALLSLGIISLYFLYAVLQNELLPAPLSFNLDVPPTEHVSLLYTVWWQLHRSQGSLLDRSSPVWQFSLGAWLPKDAFLLVAGTASVLVNLYYGLRDRAGYHGELLAGLLAAGYLVYLARGSVMLEFYVVPLIPFLAMNLGMVLARVLPLFASGATTRTALLTVFLVALLSPVGGYLLVRDTTGKVVPHDLYKLNLTALQAAQLQFIRTNIPPDSHIIMDEEFWVNLRDVRPYYPYAHSHFEATGDPAVRDKLFQQSWQNVDYIVMSNKMRVTMQQDNTSGQYDWIFDALDNHAHRIWMLQRGGIELEIWQIDK
jgi:4-amino-4-deoxy-L-arabinose transferase-like glycosyltransferase